MISLYGATLEAAISCHTGRDSTQTLQQILTARTKQWCFGEQLKYPMGSELLLYKGVFPGNQQQKKSQEFSVLPYRTFASKYLG
jgi:hypothetical protein